MLINQSVYIHGYIIYHIAIVYIYTYICISVYLYICIYVYMYICIYVCMYVYIYMYVYTNIFMSVSHKIRSFKICCFPPKKCLISHWTVWIFFGNLSNILKHPLIFATVETLNSLGNKLINYLHHYNNLKKMANINLHPLGWWALSPTKHGSL